MRTTLDIDDDVLSLAKELAAKERRTAGSVISSLARQGYQSGGKPTTTRSPAKPRQRNGIAMLPKRATPVTMAHVQKLMDEEGL
ncbi:hypothetical protein [Actomonas aquatica]|uniref:Antitoxin n=1 Tax=Actomonas aquatica TaxID=2866162 RepID=A0ABZ1C3Q7_9BACT|nr:hypothetical protein [Opitutus sp. WL0086]WRQ85868.1 hypothetical protein K1X11_013730 [Opitutus sp. WL0086]